MNKNVHFKYLQYLVYNSVTFFYHRFYFRQLHLQVPFKIKYIQCQLSNILFF